MRGLPGSNLLSWYPSRTGELEPGKPVSRAPCLGHGQTDPSGRLWFGPSLLFLERLANLRQGTASRMNRPQSKSSGSLLAIAHPID
jgi:hypothetical protein